MFDSDRVSPNSATNTSLYTEHLIDGPSATPTIFFSMEQVFRKAKKSYFSTCFCSEPVAFDRKTISHVSFKTFRAFFLEKFLNDRDGIFPELQRLKQKISSKNINRAAVKEKPGLVKVMSSQNSQL